MKLKANKKVIGLALSLVVAAVFLLASPARANWGTDILAGICSAIVSALGWILVKLMGLLVYFAQYNGFIESAAVTNGWVIVRDICNMFFVLVLLIIAFATILQIEEYNYKKWLPKLILMAILINFSKMICGLLIDAAQIVMLTFVNSFKDVAGGNLVNILGIKDWQNMDDTGAGSGWEITAGLVLAVIYAVISVIVIAAMLAMIAMRIVMLWIYIVLSPMAYLMSAFPAGKKYASQWWSQFTQNLVVGPVLAFFIWLSFASLATFSSAGFAGQGVNEADVKSALTVTQCASAVPGSKEASACAFGSSELLIKFIIAIGMLLGGMKITQEIGGVAGSAAGKVFDGGNKLALKGVKKIGGGLKKVAIGDNYLARKFAKKTGWDFRPVKLKENFKATMEASKKKDEREISDKSREHFEAGGIRSVAFGMGAGEDYFNRYIDGFMGTKGLKRAAKDVFTSPSDRKRLGSSIDMNEKDTKENEEKKSVLMESKKPVIDLAVDEAVRNDQELKDGTAELNKKQDRIEELNSQKKDRGIDKDEEKELVSLTEESKGIEDKKELRTKTVKKEALKNFISSDAELSTVDLKLKANEADLRKLKEEIMKVQKPVALQARSVYRKDVEEAKSKYKTITNSDELQKALADARLRGDKFDEIAVLEKLSGDGNFNDELLSKGYSSDAKGMYKYVNNEENDFEEKKGMSGLSDAGKMQLLGDLAESEERVNHWDMAKMTGMNNKGEMESLVTKETNEKGETVYDDTKHATAAYAEIMKMDPQQAIAKLNRLAYGGENGRGTFQIATLGKMLFKAFSGKDGAIEKHSGRMQTNAAANLSSEHIIPVLEKMMANDKDQSRKIIGAVQNRGESKDGSYKAGDMTAWVKKNG